MNFAIFRQFGALPAAGARHTVEFFPNFLDANWGAEGVTIAEREGWEQSFQADIDRRLERTTPPAHRSLEMLAPVMDSLCGRARDLPLNIPNRGQVPDLRDEVTVESICTVDGEGARGRDNARVPAPLAEYLRRVAASQELTVEAAVEGNRDKVVDALFVDPLRAPCRSTISGASPTSCSRRRNLAPTVRVAAVVDVCLAARQASFTIATRIGHFVPIR